VREHFSTELVLQDPSLEKKEDNTNRTRQLHAIATIASNHTPQTASAVYAGVLEKHR